MSELTVLEEELLKASQELLDAAQMHNDENRKHLAIRGMRKAIAKATQQATERS